MSTSNVRPSVAHRLANLNALAESSDRESAILAALEDDAPAVRDRAIRLATRYLEPATLAELVADEANATRRNAAITALERQGPYALQQLQSMLRHQNVDLVMFALQVLSRIGDPAAAPAILPLVTHQDLNVAQAAVEALGQLRSSEAVPGLLGLLKGELWLQLAAIDALGAIGDPRAVGPLIDLVPDSVVAEPAVHALLRLAAPESLEPLLARFGTVQERSLRDALLLAIGVVIGLHPDPGPVAAPLGREFARHPASDVMVYLDQVLRGSTAVHANEREESDLPRAAAALVVVAGLEALFPLLLVRLAEPEDAPWVVALFHQHPESLRPAFASLMDQEDPALRRAVLLAFTPAPDDLSRLLPHLGDPHALVRAAACRVLGLTRAAEVAPLLIERLRLGEPIEQEAAAQALTLLPAESLNELGSCLAPELGEPVLFRVLEVLTSCPMASLEQPILELAGSRSSALRRAALRALAQLPGSHADVALIRALADRNQPVQLEALELLVRRGGAKAVATLVALLSAGDSLRYHVIRALGHVRAGEAVGKLLALYPECGPHERLEIVWALIRIAPPGLAAFLRDRLAEPETEIRRVATHGLAELADTAHLPLLLGLATDPDWNVRNEAARGLGLLDLPACRDPLLTLVRDVEPVVARTARKALDRLQGKALQASA
jgi:HEAT repeat protein